MIIFTDIDDTLMKTARKIDNSEGCSIGAYNHQGQPLSYIDPQRQELIEKLLLTHTTIPVSARSRKSFANLNIHFRHHAVLNFGGTILDSDQTHNAQWHTHIAHQSAQLQQHVLYDEILATFTADIESKKVVEDDICMYLNLRDHSRSPFLLTSLREKIIMLFKQHNIENAFYFYQTDRDLAVIPSFIKKELAVQFLLKTYYHTPQLLIGIGDHANDLSFMKLCDFVLIPTDSTLMKFINNKDTTCFQAVI